MLILGNRFFWYCGGLSRIIVNFIGLGIASIALILIVTASLFNSPYASSGSTGHIFQLLQGNLICSDDEFVFDSEVVHFCFEF